MKEVFFKTYIGAIKNAFVGGSGELIMLREASLPDFCVVCCAPAEGNVYRAEFEPYRSPAFYVPIFHEIVYWMVGNHYVVDFPFCAICEPAHFDIRATQIDEKAGFFSGASKTFMKKLPSIPPELEMGLEATQAQRALRFFMR